MKDEGYGNSKRQEVNNPIMAGQSTSEQTLVERINRSDRWMIRLTAAIVIVSVVSSVISYLQWKEMSSASSQTDQAIATSMRIADAAQTTLHVDQRAWMNIVVGRAVLEDGKPINVPISIINKGKTPAYNVKGSVVINLLKNEEQPDFNYISGHPYFSFDSSTIVPNFSNNMNWPILPKYVPKEKELIPIKATSSIRKGIAQGSLYIVVHARITYEDIFGVDHWINYCSYIRNIVGVQEETYSDFCGSYNDVDKNN